MSSTGRARRRAALSLAAVVTASSALSLGSATSAQAHGSAPSGSAPHRSGSAFAAGPLVDLDPAAGPLDGASAVAVAVPVGKQSTVVALLIRGVDRSAAGRTFGAHVHVGPCLPMQPAAALGHYNTGGPASPTTEVWLDFTVTRSGSGLSVTRVPFRIAAGDARSVVVHAEATAPSGAAGGRQACLPLEFR